MLTAARFLAIVALFQASLSFAFDFKSLDINIDTAVFSSELNHQSINSIYRDHAGFLWVATQLGLNRFDGSNVLIFKPDKGSEHWIPDSEVSDIAEDSSGNLWIATGRGIAKYDAVKQTFFQSFSNTPRNSLNLKTLIISSNGKIWFGGKDSGVGMYDPVLQRFSKWTQRESLRVSVGQTTQLIEDKVGNIWASGSKGVYLVNPIAQKIKAFELPSTLLSNTSSEIVTAMTARNPNQILVGTNKGDLLTFNTLSGKFTSGEEVRNLSGSWITDIEFFSKKIWISTDNGIYLIDDNPGNPRKLLQDNTDMSNSFVSSLFADTEVMWVGTALGLNYLSLSTFERFQAENSGVFNDVMSFTEGIDNNIWVGTYNGAFSLDKERKVHQSIEEIYPKLVLNDKRVMTASAKNDDLWLGFYSGGIQVIDQKAGTSTTPLLPKNSELAVTDILHARDGTTWVSTYNHGLFRISTGNIEQFYKRNEPNHGIFEPAITIVSEIKDGSILVVAESKMFKIDVSSGKIEELDLVFEEDHGSTVILSIAEDSNGQVWIGTKDLGLFIWDRSKDSIFSTELRAAPGNSRLQSRTIYAIEFDDRENVWVSTTSGISKLNSNGELLANFKPKDGLQGNDFNFSASFLDSSGWVYFGGSNGYNRFDPSKTKAIENKPPVAVTGVKVAGTTHQLPVPAHKLKSIELSHRDHSITFSFTVLDYIDPKNNKYRHKLINFDPEWIENGTNNSATYTNLPTGNYVFHVQGANSAGVWNREGATVALTIHPAPWWSWQAYLAYLLLLSTIVVLVKSYYDGIALRDRALALASEMQNAADRANDDLQEQLDFQDDFLQTVYQHGRDTLGVIRDFLDPQANLFADELFRDAILSNVQRVDALRQLEKNLLYHGDQLLISPEQLTNSIFNAQLQHHSDIAPTIITINQMPAQPIAAEHATPLCIILFELIRNCFEHAFESTSGANYIQVELKKIRNQQDTGAIKEVQILVYDSGVGIPDNILTGAVETAGLAIVSSVLEKLGGKIQASENQGTRIILTIPGSMGLT